VKDFLIHVTTMVMDAGLFVDRWLWLVELGNHDDRIKQSSD